VTQAEVYQRINYINCLYFTIDIVDCHIVSTDEITELVSLKNQLIDLTSEIIIQKKIINADYQNDQATIERLLSLD